MLFCHVAMNMPSYLDQKREHVSQSNIEKYVMQLLLVGILRAVLHTVLKPTSSTTIIIGI